MRLAWLMIVAASTATAQPLVPIAGADTGATIAPADRLAQLDRFRDRLSPGDRARLDRALPRSADGGIARCDRIVASRASCEAAAYMPALRSTGLLPRFLATIDQRTAPRSPAGS